MVVSNVLKILWSILKPKDRYWFLTLVFWTFISGIFEMAGMMAILGFISGLSTKGPDQQRRGAVARLVEFVAGGPIPQTTYVLLAGGGVLVFIIFKNLQSMSAQFLMNRFLMKRNLVLSTELFEGYLSAPYEQLQPRTVAQVQKKISEIFSVFSTSFTSTAQVIADALTLAMVTLLLFYVNPVLTSVAAVMFGGIGTAIYWSLQRTLKSMARQESEARNNASKFLEQAFGGIVETRLRDLRAYFVRHYERAIGRTSLLRRRKLALDKMPRSTNEILLTAMIVGSVLYLSLSGSDLVDALPTLGLFGFAGLRMTGAMSRLNNNIQRLRQGNERMMKLANIMRTVTSSFAEEGATGHIGRYTDAEGSGSADLQLETDWQLKLDKIHFRFPGTKKPVITDISLRLRRGDYIAFCGPSGGGKSTLLKLLMGLLVPTKGTIECDGWNIYQHIRTWHRQIGYVGQHTFLTDEPVRNNVAFGVAEQKIDDQKVTRALKLACALDFVEALPKGIRTPIQSGDILSGGQKQRILIARALYNDPSILIFDEATAALDNETERAISQAVSDLSATKTIVVVAHRLGTIRDCGKIYFLAEGRIVDAGTYDQLLERCVEFKDMVKAGNLEKNQLSSHVGS